MTKRVSLQMARLGLWLALLWLLLVPAQIGKSQTSAGQSATDLRQPLPFLEPLGHLAGLTGAGALAVTDDHLYYLDAQGGIEIIDVSDPTQMRAVGAIAVASRVTALTVATRPGVGDLVYLGDQEGRLTRIDVTDPTDPHLQETFTAHDLGIAEGLTAITSLSLAGDGLLLVVDTQGMHVIDISAPDAAWAIGFYALEAIQQVQTLTATSALLEHANGRQITLVDLSDPAHPTRLDLLDRFGAVDASAAAHGYLYVATNDTMQNLLRNTQLWIIELSSAGAPSFTPQESARYRDPLVIPGHTAAGQMAIAGSLLYLATDAGLTVFDVRDPQRPIQIEQRPIAYGEPPYPVVQPQSGDGRTFFLSAEDGTLTALRSRPPFVPTSSLMLELVGHLGGESQALVVEDGWAYMSNGPEISLLDLSQPTAPRRVDYFIDADVGEVDRNTRIHAMLARDSVDGQDASLAQGAAHKLLYVLETWQLRILEVAEQAGDDGSCRICVLSSLPHGNSPDADTRVQHVRNDPIVREERRSGQTFTRAGDHLYILVADCWRPGSHAVCKDFLRIVEVADPTAPRVVADVALFDTHYQLLGDQQIVVADDRAYISSNQGLRILDVSDPAAPLVLDQSQGDGRDSGSWLAVDGTRLYLLHWAGHLRVLDASDPAALVDLADHAWSGGATGLLLHEEFLFVAGYQATQAEAGSGRAYGWFVFDRSAGDAPLLLGFFPTDSEIAAMSIDEHPPAPEAEMEQTWLYLTTASGLRVVDVTDPHQPHTVGFYGAPTHMADLHVEDGLAALAGGYSDPLYLVDISRPALPEGMGQITVVQGARLARAGDTVVVAKQERLQVVDVSDPATPSAIASFSAPGDIQAVTLRDVRAYLYWQNSLDQAAGVQIVNVDTHDGVGALGVEGAISIPFTNTSTARLTFYGERLYLLLGNRGLYLLDIVDASAPQLLAGPLALMGDDLVIGDEFAYLASNPALYQFASRSTGSVQVLNLAHMAQPQFQTETGLGLLGKAWRAKRMVAQGGLLYVADEGVGLRVLDISIPIAPVEAGQIGAPAAIQDIAVADDILYVTTYDSGLFVYKATALAKPDLVARSPAPEFGSDGVIVGQRADDGALLRSTDGGASWSAWSPPLAYVANVTDSEDEDGNREIYVADAQGENPRRLTAHAAADETPAWSPGWSHIIFASQRSGNWDLYSIRVDCAPDRPHAALGCELRQLTDDPADDLLPAWSPDGRQIAFVSLRDGNPEIYVMHSDGSQPRRVTYDPSGDWRPAWLPNSRELVFTSGRLGNNDLFRLDVSYVSGADEAAAQPVALVTGPADERDPALSDGRTLLFVSDRDGPPRVYRMAMEEAGAGDAAIRPLAATGEADEYAEGHPAWTADNQVLVARAVGEETQIYRVAEGSYALLIAGERFHGHPAAMPVWWIPK